MCAQADTPKIFIFEFVGGVRDGKTMRSDRAEDINDMRRIRQLTWNGMVGRRFDVATQSEPVSQRYQVAGKYENDSEVRIMCKYVGEA